MLALCTGKGLLYANRDLLERTILKNMFCLSWFSSITNTERKKRWWKSGIIVGELWRYFQPEMSTPIFLWNGNSCPPGICAWLQFWWMEASPIPRTEAIQPTCMAFIDAETSWGFPKHQGSEREERLQRHYCQNRSCLNGWENVGQAPSLLHADYAQHSFLFPTAVSSRLHLSFLSYFSSWPSHTSWASTGGFSFHRSGSAWVTHLSPLKATRAVLCSLPTGFLKPAGAAHVWRENGRFIHNIWYLQGIWEQIPMDTEAPPVFSLIYMCLFSLLPSWTIFLAFLVARFAFKMPYLLLINIHYVFAYLNPAHSPQKIWGT